MNERPDILVLGGGGHQGDAWMTGVLAGLEDAHGIGFGECDYLVGTSAGAIVATKLASGRRLRRPTDNGGCAATPERSPLPPWASAGAMALAAPFAAVGVRLGRSSGELVRSAALRALNAPAEAAPDFDQAFPADRVRFDGRLRIVSVDRQSGRRVVFGAPGAPHATVARALSASCALPLVFSPVVIGGREYVDGAVWSPTNADVAPRSRDARVLVLAPMSSFHGPFNAPLRAASRATMLLEVSALKARGARVRIVTPNRASSSAIGPDLMSDVGLQDTAACGYQQGLGL